MIKKKNIFSFLVFVAVVVVVVVVGLYVISKNYQNNSLIEKPIVKVGVSISKVENAVLILAAEKNFFDKYNIKVEVVPFRDPAEIAAALALGQINIGFAGVDSLAIPLAKGGPIKLVGFSSESPVYLFVRSDGLVNSLDDLVGRSIALRMGSGAESIFRKILKDEGIEEKQITFMDMASNERLVALVEKKAVDAALTSGNGESAYKQAGATVMKEWSEKGYDQNGSPWVLAMNTDFLTDHSDLAEAFVNGYVDGYKFLVTEKTASANLVSEVLAKESEGINVLKPEEILTIWSTNQVKYLLWDDVKIAVDLVAVGNELGQIDRVLTADELFDFRFQKKLEEAQQEI